MSQEQVHQAGTGADVLAAKLGRDKLDKMTGLQVSEEDALAAIAAAEQAAKMVRHTF
jgi:hypothetical protein